MVTNCRGGYRICREDVDTKDSRTDREDRPIAREGEEAACGGTSVTEDNGCSLVLALMGF